MNNKKITGRLKRSLALLLAVVMLPFADYGQAFAYSGMGAAPVQDAEGAVVSGNIIDGQKSGGNDSDGKEAGGPETEEKVEDGTGLENTQGGSIAAERAGMEDADERGPWERITFQEAESIKLADPSGYEDMSVEADAYVLEEDMEVGDLFVSGGSLDLNGHSLTVYGTLLQSAGEVRLSGGRLLIGGDYRIQTREEKENPELGEESYFYKESSGQLIMREEADYLFLCGSFFTDSDVSHEGNLTAGTMEVMGDFVQLSTKSRLNFVASDAHKVIFSGAEGQEISFQSSSLQESRFANMEIGFMEDEEESSGSEVKEGEEAETEKACLTFRNCPCVSGKVSDSGKRRVDGQIGIGTSTSFVNGYFGGGSRILQPIQIEPNEKIQLGGDVEIAQTVSVYGILETEGNITITGAGVSMEGGRLLAEGNLTVSRSYNSGIKMNHGDDYVFAGGNFTYNPIWEQELSAGTLEIKGNAAIQSGFHASGSHKTVLSGESKQTVTMAEGMYFCVLELKNQSREGVCSEKVLPKSSLTRNGCRLVYGEMEGSYGYTLEKDEVIEGDFILIDDTLDLNGHSLKVKGDLVQAAGDIVINGGYLTVEGDYRQQSIKAEEGSGENAGAAQELQEEGKAGEKVYGASAGLLWMDRESDRVLINGSMYVETIKDTTGKLTGGVLELKGDFIQKRTGCLNNFKAEGEHTLLLSGTERQTVCMEYSAVEGSRIANLEIQNKSRQGTVFENSPYIAGTIMDSRNKVSGQIAIGSSTQFGEGYFGGSVCTLQEISVKGGEEIEIGGDMESNHGISIFGSLSVKGNMKAGQTWNSGGIGMEGGSLCVGKDLTLGGDYYSNGIRMKNESDYILVEGDFLYRPHDNLELSAGTLELKGNADIQKNFYAAGTHRTLLSGSKKQTITMADGLYFNILELQNHSEDGVYSEKALQKSQLIRNGCKLTYGMTEGEYGETLEEDRVVEGNYILLDDTLDLNGHSLTVKGDFIQPAGEVYINGGNLIIEGDYRQQAANTGEESQPDDYGVSTGLLHMEKEADYVLVKGSMYVQTTAGTDGKLTAGLLEIKGDFIQKRTSNLGNFNPSGSHTLLLSGEGKQTVSFEYSAVGSSHIENLEISNVGTEGVEFAGIPYVAGNIKNQKEQKVSGKIGIGGTTVFQNGYFGGSIYTLQQVSVKEGEEIEIGGDMESNPLLSIYGSLILRGNMQVSLGWYAGGIGMEGGSLKVGKDLVVGGGGYSNGVRMSHETDHILVEGDFLYQPQCANRLSAGTLELKGNVDILSGFHATDTHRTLLSGDKKQTITMADGLYFNILELQNHSDDGIYSEKALQKSRLIRNGCKLTYGNIEGNYGYTLEKDEAIEGDFVLIDDTLDLNGYTLTINGDLIQPGGEIFINGGKLVIEGNYRQQGRKKDEEKRGYSYEAGTGLLHMEKEADYVLVKGGMYVQTTAGTAGKLTAGTLEVKGDFIQKKTSNLENFNPSGGHTLLLTGQGKQTVSFEHSAVGNSHIENLEIDNSGTEGVEFAGLPYVSGNIKNQKEQKVSGKIGIGSNTVFQNGYFGGSICTLQQVSVKEGEEIEIGGNMESNLLLSIYGRLTVRGNMEVSLGWYAGGIAMEGGSLKVGKNLTVGGGGYSNGVRMNHETDHILVEGDFLYQPQYVNQLSAGILELKGNADIRSGFHAAGTHRTLLSGNKKQTITMADGLYFNILELQNHSDDGVYSEKALRKSRLIRNGCKLTYGDMEGVYGYTLEQDETIEGNFVLIDDTLDLNGNTLTIKGDLLHPGGEIFINGGRLIIEGDYRQQGRKKSGEEQGYSYEAGNGLLRMEKEADYVLVKGGMYVQTTAGTAGKLTAGVLEVKGDFIQKKTSNLENFNPSGGHTLLLTGEGKQTVSFEYSAVGSSHIENMEIDNAGTEGVEFAGIPYVAGSIKNQREQKASGKIGIGSNTVFPSGYFGGSICNLQQVDIKEGEELRIEGNLESGKAIYVHGSLTVAGNVESNHGILIYGSMDVKGNMKAGQIWDSGGIGMEGGSLRVGKDLTLGGDSYSDGIRMRNESDYILVEGDFLYRPYDNLELSAGTLELKGNADIQKNFYATGTHRTLLSGNKKQTITMADGLYFNILELQNHSDDGIYSEKALKKSQLIRNGCKLTYGDTAGIYGFTLSEDYIAEGDFILLEDTMDLNGHTLTIRGDLIQAGGEILINGGTLNVEGDYRQQTRKLKNEKIVYEPGSGFLTMTKDTDLVQIEGSFITQTTADMQGHLTKGTLKIKGDFKQLGSHGFAAGEGHTLCLNGGDTQKLTMETVPVIGSLTVENTSRMGAVLNSNVTVLGTAEDPGSALSGTGSLMISSLSQLAGDNCGGNIKLSGENTLNKDITIEGVLTVDGILKLDVHKLQANACMINGALHVENGTLLLSSYLNVNEGAHFAMTGAGGYALVNGNLNFASRHAHNGLLTGGTLEVRGDFAQKTAANFIATDSHTTVLGKKLTTTGRTKIQTISFTHPGTARFHRLVLKKNLKTGYIFHQLPETIADEVVYEATDETPPTAVGQISIGSVTPTSITISYQEAVDDTGVTGYEIHRNGRKIAVTGALSYTDTGLAPDTAYTYTVYAFDEDRNLSLSSEEIEITTLTDDEAPGQVTGLSITSSTGSSITLSWKPAPDNVKTEYYSLYRNGELVADNIQDTAYKDTGLNENTLYIYTITASDKAGNVSEKSQEVHGAVTIPKITYVSPEDYAAIGGESVTLTARFSSAGNSIGNQMTMEYFDEDKDTWKAITPLR